MRKLAALFALLFVGFIATPALADNSVFDRAADGLKQSPVYVDPSMTKVITSSDVQQIVRNIEDGNDPIFIAIIPDSAGAAAGGYDNTPKAVGITLDRPGVYGVVVGQHFRAGSSGVLAKGQAGALATLAFQSNNPGKFDPPNITPMLMNFVDRVQDSLHPGPTTQTTSKPGKSHVGLVLGIIGGIILLILLIVGAALLVRRRAEEAAEREEFEQETRNAKARLAEVQDDVLGLGSPANASAKQCADSAVSAVSRASSVIDAAVTVQDFAPAYKELDNAEALASDARLYEAGRDPVVERKQAEAEAAAAAEARRKAQAKEEAERAKKVKKISPEKYKPRQRESATYNNYFGGGYYNGMYYGPGYYADPFWTWVIMDEIFDDNDPGYDHGSSYDDNSSGGNDWSSNNDSSSGGDWDSGSSSSDFSSSFSGGGDWGGGGGGDFSGGGGDSGGGGGGDW